MRMGMTERPRALGYGWYVVGILFIVTTFSQFDRQLTSLLVRPLKQALVIDDTQFSLLHGYAFAITYSLLGVPFGRLVDRGNRRNLIVFGMLIWSTTTVLAGFAQSFWQLLIARMGVGLGEAVLAPAAYSIIADLFDARSRGRAIGIYYTSLAVGTGASFMLGAALLQSIPAAGLSLPGGLQIAQWQTMFVLAGVPGFLLVLLPLTFREPQRLERRTVESVPVRAFLGHIWKRRRAFLRLFAVPALLAIAGYGLLGWAPSLFERRFGIPPMQSGGTLGLIVLVTGVIGPPLAGALSDNWAGRGIAAARLRVILLASTALVPLSFWAVAPTPGMSFALLALALLALAIAQAAMPVTLYDLVFNEMRGQIVAVYLLIAGLAGIGFGPTSVALLTDYVFQSDAMLPWSLVAVGFPSTLVAAWTCFRAMKPYQQVREERARAG